MTNGVKLLLILAILVLVGIFGYKGYSAIEDIGYQKAKTECAENFKKYERDRDAKIAKIEEDSSILVADTQLRNDKLTRKNGELIKQLKAKPLVLVKDGKCEITEIFSDSFGKINQTTNQSRKGTVK